MNEEFNWLYYLLPLSSLLSDFIKKKKESSRPISRVLCLLPKKGKRCLSFIYSIRHRYGSSELPSSSGGLPSNAGLHALTTPKADSAMCHHTPGELLPHLLTLTFTKKGGYFLLHYSTLADCLPLTSGMPYVARTFLFHLPREVPATNRPTAFEVQRYEKFCNSSSYSCENFTEVIPTSWSNRPPNGR